MQVLLIYYSFQVNWDTKDYWSEGYESLRGGGD